MRHRIFSIELVASAAIAVGVNIIIEEVRP
jgi:hypothetical protein